MNNVLTVCAAQGLNLKVVARNQFTGQIALEMAANANIPSSEVLETLLELGYDPICVEYLKVMYAR